MKLGVAVLSDNSTMNRLISIQRDVGVLEKLEPTLDIDGNLPHTTILQGRFKSLDYVKSQLPVIERFISDLGQPIKLTPTKVKYVDAGWYFLEVKPSPWISTLHSFVFNLLKTQMYLSEKDKANNISGYSTKEKESYLAYGYRYIGELYSPHITIGRTSNRKKSINEEQVIKIIERNIPEEIMISKLSIYKFGENGSHSDTLSYINI